MSKKTAKILKEEHSGNVQLLNHLSNEAEGHLSKHMMEYIAHATNPKAEKVALRPAPAGTYVGLCEPKPVLARGELVVGSGGYGVLAVSLNTAACCADRAIGTVTDATFAGGSPTPIPSSAATGVTPIYAVGCPQTGVGLTGNTGESYLSLVNAGAILVKPVDSATAQNGVIDLLEVQGHPVISGTTPLTIGQVASHPRTRVVDGVQLGSPNFLNVLNWHPQTSEKEGGQYITSDNFWRAPSGALAGIDQYELIVVVQGDPGTRYFYEIYASYALRGSRTTPSVPMYSDPIGEAIYMNAIADKRMSGWVGSTGLAKAIYASVVAHSARRLQPKAVADVEKARAALDREKARKEARQPSGFANLFRSALPIAKELGGFLLNSL